MTPKVKAVVAVLPAAHVEESLAWWIGVCGFAETFRDQTPANYAGITRDGASIHLARVGEPALAKTVADQTMVRIVVDDVAGFFAEYKQRGGVVDPNGGLAKKPWGTLEFAAIDPAGVCITFLE